MQLKVVVDRIDRDQVILITEDGIALLWPKSKLPANTKQGQTLLFQINLQTNNQALDQATLSAVDMINQIIQAE